MTCNKDVNRIIKDALKRGWVFVRKGKHLVYKYKNNKTVVVSITPSSRNAWKEIEKNFKDGEKN